MKQLLLFFALVANGIVVAETINPPPQNIREQLTVSAKASHVEEGVVSVFPSESVIFRWKFTRDAFESQNNLFKIPDIDPVSLVDQKRIKLQLQIDGLFSHSPIGLQIKAGNYEEAERLIELHKARKDKQKP